MKFVTNVRGNKTEYLLDKAPESAIVRVGGFSTAKFVPNINVSKWNDECWLNINHPDRVEKEVEIFSSGKIETGPSANPWKSFADTAPLTLLSQDQLFILQVSK